MTVITCGVTSLNAQAEAIMRHMREAEGFRTDGGCQRAFNLDSALLASLIYRCVECGRWLCKPCILAHFAETQHDRIVEELALDRPSVMKEEPCSTEGSRPRPAGAAAPSGRRTTHGQTAYAPTPRSPSAAPRTTTTTHGPIGPYPAVRATTAEAL